MVTPFTEQGRKAERLRPLLRYPSPRGYPLREIGRHELSPCAVADGEHQHGLPAFIDLINDPIDVRFLAIKQVP